MHGKYMHKFGDGLIEGLELYRENEKLGGKGQRVAPN